jgi:hypothetical protein
MTAKILVPDWPCDETPTGPVPETNRESGVLAFDDGANRDAAFEADTIFDMTGGIRQEVHSFCCND